jgi:hypothetical protein
MAEGRSESSGHRAATAPIGRIGWLIAAFLSSAPSPRQTLSLTSTGKPFQMRATD